MEIYAFRKVLLQKNSLAQRGPYYTRVRVSSQDENKLYTISVTIMESKDGGKTFKSRSTVSIAKILKLLIRFLFSGHFLKVVICYFLLCGR